MELLQWLTETQFGEFWLTVLVSMLPVVELRGGIPFGVAAGLELPVAFGAAFLGNMLPVPFLILFTRRVLQWLKANVRMFRGAVSWLERKADKKKDIVLRYSAMGLFILVAIPLPGTGAWTGSLVAAILEMRLRKALPSVVLGVLTAGCIMLALTHVGINLFSGSLSGL